MEALFGSTDNPDLSSVLTSCEPELQELMRQIDIMISSQKEEWEAERRDWEVQVKSGHQERLTLGSLIKRRDREIEMLRKQQEDLQMDRQEIITKYEQQLQKVRDELDKLKRNYHKLQRKQQKDTSGGKDRHLFQHQDQLTSLEAQNRSLADKLSLAKSQLSSLLVEKEHRECCLEVQRLRLLCATSQERLDSNQLELQRLRPLEATLGRTQPELQLLPAGCVDLHPTANTSLHRTATEHQRLHNQAAVVNQGRRDQVNRSLDVVTGQREQQLKSHDSSLTQIKKLREELQSTEQVQSGMRKELSLLTSELHQRDITIAALRRPSDVVEQQLKTTQKQLEALQRENQRLSRLLHTPTTADPSGASLKKTSVLQSDRGLQEADSAHELDIHRPREQLCASSPSEQLVYQDSRPPSGSSSSSVSRTTPSHTNLLPTSTSRPFIAEHQRPNSDVGTAPPLHNTVSRFLDEESSRCNELQQKLDSHIQGLKESNVRTLSKYQPSDHTSAAIGQ